MLGFQDCIFHIFVLQDALSTSFTGHSNQHCKHYTNRNFFDKFNNLFKFLVCTAIRFYHNTTLPNKHHKSVQLFICQTFHMICNLKQKANISTYRQWVKTLQCTFHKSLILYSLSSILWKEMLRISTCIDCWYHLNNSLNCTPNKKLYFF